MLLNILPYLSVNHLLLVVLLLLALIFDLGGKRIPNFITFPAVLGGLAYHTITAGWGGLQFSLLGFFLGMAIFFIPFAMGGMGAGDVKLMGAVGALQGWQFVLYAAFLTALCGGVMALVYLIYTRRLGYVLKKLVGKAAAPILGRLYYATRLELFNRGSVYFHRALSEESRENTASSPLPYGAAIAAGSLLLLTHSLVEGGINLQLLPW